MKKVVMSLSPPPRDITTPSDLDACAYFLIVIPSSH